MQTAKWQIVDNKFFDELLRKPYAGIIYSFDVHFSRPPDKRVTLKRPKKIKSECLSELLDYDDEEKNSFRFQYSHGDKLVLERCPSLKEVERHIQGIYEVALLNDLKIDSLELLLVSHPTMSKITIKENKLEYENQGPPGGWKSAKKDKRPPIEEFLEGSPHLRPIS